MLLAETVRLTRIDASNIGPHSRLLLADECYFLFEYTSHKSFDFSTTNNLISNLKKKPSERLTKGGWGYKARAINECSTLLRRALNPNWLAKATIVPVPPSKALDHPDYDDRIEQICRQLGPQVNVRPLIQQSVSTVAAHEAGDGARITVEELTQIYRVDESQAHPAPQVIGVVDDVLTAGTHFRAMDAALRKRFPGVPVLGFFIARRVFPDDPFELQIGV